MPLTIRKKSMLRMQKLAAEAAVRAGRTPLPRSTKRVLSLGFGARGRARAKTGNLFAIVGYWRFTLKRI